jgi:D-aminopeptidase
MTQTRSGAAASTAGPARTPGTSGDGAVLRARDHGFPFDGQPGPQNSITDVPGVEVGYTTLVEGDDVRSGVTAIHPRGRANPKAPVIAGFHSQNGQGEMTGMHWVQESGTFSGPVVLTSTHSVGAGHTGVCQWMKERHPDVAEGWLLPVVAETWDGYLNDLNGGHITPDLVRDALDSASSGPVAEGGVGGGTGMTCYGYKGGSGISSRQVAYGGQTYHVAVFVQANFGSREELTICGVPVGRHLLDDNPAEVFFTIPAAGSILVIIATDAPMLSDQCRALARRATYGLARTGSTGDHFSGDLFLAFSTANSGAVSAEDDALRGRLPERLDSVEVVPWGHMDPFNTAVTHATEEAIVNALVAGQEMVGNQGRRIPKMPIERVQAMVHPVVKVRGEILAQHSTAADTAAGQTGRAR